MAQTAKPGIRILIIEDDASLAELVRDWFENKEFAVTVKNDGTAGYREALTGRYDAVILDVMLPGMDGWEILSSLRKRNVSTPVLMLTARSELSDRLRGFECGAEDYLTKPFAVEELEARVRVLTGKRAPQTGSRNADVLTCGDLVLDTKSRYLGCGSRQVRLSGREYDLAEYFFRNPELVLSKEQITEAVWGGESGAEYNQTEVYISFLRRKLRFLGTKARLVTLRGAGYSLQPEEGREQ